MKKKMTNQEKTFLAIVIPVLLLFFAFNTLPMLKGVVYSFTNYRGYGSYGSLHGCESRQELPVHL